MVFSSYLFLFYFLPVALLLLLPVAAARAASDADDFQLCLLRLGQPAVPVFLLLFSTAVDYSSRDC